MEYNNINSIVNGFTKVLSVSSKNIAPIPSALIFSGVPMRSGLSAIKIASRIISRKQEAGLSVGVLPSGEPSPDEIMERIRFEVFIEALQQEGIIIVSIPPGISLTAAGISAAGPVTVQGSTINFVKGYGIIQ